MGSPQGWGQQLAGTPRCSCIIGSRLSPYYSLQSKRYSCFPLSCLSSTVWRLMMSNSCLRFLELLIADVFFLNSDALTHLFLQPLACIIEVQLRGRGGYGLYITGTGGNGFETDGYGRGWAWKLRVRGGGFGSDGDGQGSCSTFVPVQVYSSHGCACDSHPPPAGNSDM